MEKRKYLMFETCATGFLRKIYRRLNGFDFRREQFFIVSFIVNLSVFFK